jgi:hypothetical protein
MIKMKIDLALNVSKFQGQKCKVTIKAIQNDSIEKIPFYLKWYGAYILIHLPLINNKKGLSAFNDESAFY